MKIPIERKELLNMLPADFGIRISVLDGCKENTLPDWAALLIWLGAWCRHNQVAGHRLIVFAVLPTRDLAAAFAGIGCLVAGSSTFEDALSWQKFRKLPSGRNVFWVNKSTGACYSGDIVAFSEIHGDEFIEVRVSKSKRKNELGMVIKVNQRYFDEYRFTESKPLSVAKAASLDAVGNALEALVGSLNPKWLWSDTAEGLIVTQVSLFESSIESLSLSIDSRLSLTMSDFLCMGRNNDREHAKLRLDHPKGTIEGIFPLVILDGVRAFMVREHLSAAGNMLIILDRAEYQVEVHEIVKSLKSFSQGYATNLSAVTLERFTPGVEIAAYLINES